MPEFAVNSDETQQASAALLNDFSQLQDKLSEIRNKVQILLKDGYRTPAAQQTFEPAFEEFALAFVQLNSALQGMGEYLRGVGETYEEADARAGQRLRG